MRTFAFGARGWEYAHLCTGVHKKAEATGAIHYVKKATRYRARTACRH